MSPATNPFNPVTTIAFHLVVPEIAEIAIYDLKGSRIRTLRRELLAAGRHEVQWDGMDNRGKRVASGIYMVRMTTDNFKEMKKLLLVKYIRLGSGEQNNLWFAFSDNSGTHQSGIVGRGV